MEGIAKRPGRLILPGDSARLEPLTPDAHGVALWEGSSGAENDELWLYMGDGPYPQRDAFDASLAAKADSGDPLFYAIVDPSTGLATGYASLMRIDTKNRVIEVGNILYTRALQRTRAATEAM